jgi:hypothetical protein
MKQAKCIIKIKKLIKEKHPDINLVDLHIPLTNGLPAPKLKDILESEVDEKYYIKSALVEKIAAEADFSEKLISLKTEKNKK